MFVVIQLDETGQAFDVPRVITPERDDAIEYIETYHDDAHITIDGEWDTKEDSIGKYTYTRSNGTFIYWETETYTRGDASPSLEGD